MAGGGSFGTWQYRRLLLLHPIRALLGILLSPSNQLLLPLRPSTTVAANPTPIPHLFHADSSSATLDCGPARSLADLPSPSCDQCWRIGGPKASGGI